MSESFRHLWGRTGDATPPTPDPRERGEDAWTIVRKALLDACAVDRNPLHKYEHVSARLDAIAAQCADRVLALRAPAPSGGEEEYVPPPASDEAQLIASISRPTDMVSLTRAAFDSLTDEVVALRAKVAAHPSPAPSEAMAKDLATVTAVCAVGENHPIGCSAREHGVFFCDCGFTDAVTRLNTHPAARGVTVEEREVMGDIALDGFIDWCDLDPTDENRSASALARQYLALRQKSRTPDAEGGA